MKVYSLFYHDTEDDDYQARGVFRSKEDALRFCAAEYDLLPHHIDDLENVGRTSWEMYDGEGGFEGRLFLQVTELH